MTQARLPERTRGGARFAKPSSRHRRPAPLPPPPQPERGRRSLTLGAGILSLLGAVAVLAALTLPGEAVEPAPPSRVVSAPVAKGLDGTVVGPGTPAGDSKVVRMRVAGEDRAYLLLPALGRKKGEAGPLLVVLHQDVGSAREVAAGLGLDALRREGVTLAYPAGVGGSWNAGGCCGDAKERGVDDVAFVNAVLDDVGRHVPVVATRRAVLGYSGGGMLLYRLLCREHPPLVAAVEVNGSLEAHCPTSVRLPDLLSVHGVDDGTVGLLKPKFVKHLGVAPRSVESTLTAITSRADCRGRTSVRVQDAQRVRWAACSGGSTVEAQFVLDAGHGWEDVGAAERAMSWLRPRLLA